MTEEPRRKRSKLEETPGSGVRDRSPLELNGEAAEGENSRRRRRRERRDDGGDWDDDEV